MGLSFHVFIRIKEKKEDQRITKGLQLLQHKIAILQDLSDKADEQVQRLVHVLDNKSNELRRATTFANETIRDIQEKNQQLTKNEVTSTSQAAQNLVNQITDNIKLDEFSQFVEALNIQNEKTKSNITANAVTMPQSFVEPVNIENQKPNTELNVKLNTKDQVRPFEFRKISR